MSALPGPGEPSEATLAMHVRHIQSLPFPEACRWWTRITAQLRTEQDAATRVAVAARIRARHAVTRTDHGPPQPPYYEGYLDALDAAEQLVGAAEPDPGT